jgi:hypothetical protein
VADDDVPLSSLSDWLKQVGRVPLSSLGIDSQDAGLLPLASMTPSGREPLRVTVGPRPSPSEQWESAIQEQKLRDAQKPSMGQQIADIANNTVGIMGAPVINLAQRMGNAFEHGIDWGDPEQVKETSGRTLMDMMALAGGTAGAAERGTVGALGGKPITAYHGSPHNFNAFDTSKTNQGVWLAKDPDAASRYIHGNGNLYKVDINAPIESFIDRSKPIDQQSESVRNVIEGIENDLGMTRREGAAGGDFYADLARKLAGNGPHLQGLVKANDLLRERGIPGINDGDTQIVFDDKLLNITHKNGVPVEDAAGAAGRGTISDLDREMLTQGMQRAAERRANELQLPRLSSSPSSEALMNPAIISRRLEQSADTKAGREFQAAQDKAAPVVSAWREAFKAHGEEIPSWLEMDPEDAIEQAEYLRTAHNGIFLPDWFHEMLNQHHSTSVPLSSLVQR